MVRVSNGFILLSVSTLTEQHKTRTTKIDNEDDVEKINVELLHQKVDMGFGVDQDGCFKDNQKDVEKNSEDSDGVDEEKHSFTQFVPKNNRQILGLFGAKNTGLYGYLVVNCKLQFTVLYVYDETLLKASYDVVYELDYSFDRELKRYG